MESSNPGRLARTLHVTIVSDNPETLDGLEAYLRRAGVTTNGARDIDRLSEEIPPTSKVVLLFPDDFQWGAVTSALAMLRVRRPQALTVLVTKEPKRFDWLVREAGEMTPLVVPKPAWGWAILDAIRTRVEADEQKSR